MIDPGTGITILGSAIGGAKLLEKLLGPTADYIGLEIKNLTEGRIKNIARIFKKANDKLGSSLTLPGSIPPRVLKEILEEGSYCEDDLMAEYYGGILASGRSPDGKDDRAIPYLKLTSELSSYQIRLHYIVYIVFRNLFTGSGLNPMLENDLINMTTFFPFSLLQKAMNLDQDVVKILLESAMGLDRHSVLVPAVWGSETHINKLGKERFHGKWISINESGLTINPTQYGIDYFLWATGNGSFGRQQFLLPELKIAELPEIQIEATAMSVLKNNR